MRRWSSPGKVELDEERSVSNVAWVERSETRATPKRTIRNALGKTGKAMADIAFPLPDDFFTVLCRTGPHPYWLIESRYCTMRSAHGMQRGIPRVSLRSTQATLAHREHEGGHRRVTKHVSMRRPSHLPGPQRWFRYGEQSMQESRLLKAVGDICRGHSCGLDKRVAASGLGGRVDPRWEGSQRAANVASVAWVEQKRNHGLTNH
jgi:hypothetical protein